MKPFLHVPRKESNFLEPATARWANEKSKTSSSPNQTSWSEGYTSSYHTSCFTLSWCETFSRSWLTFDLSCVIEGCAKRAKQASPEVNRSHHRRSLAMRKSGPLLAKRETFGDAKVVVDSASPGRYDGKKTGTPIFSAGCRSCQRVVRRSQTVVSFTRGIDMGWKQIPHQIEIWNEYSSELSQPSIYKIVRSLLPFNLMRLPRGSLNMKGNHLFGGEPI